MRKEILYAILGGIIFGLIVAFGFYRINSRLSTSKKSLIPSKPVATPINFDSKEFKIVLDKPENNDVLTQSTIMVSGITKPTTFVIINGENSDYIVQTNSEGVFNQEVELVAGINQIKVTAFDSKGTQSTTDVLVVYSSSFLERTTSSPSPQDSTESATVSSDIRKKVAQDVANTINRPKAYIGTVTDITDSTIEIKTGVSEIKQISIGTVTTSVVNAVGTANKTVKTSDIAIGDFIVAMGYIQTSSVLGAQRILISNPISKLKIVSNKAVVTAISKKSLTVKMDDKEETITPDTKTNMLVYKDGKVATTKLASILQDDTIIYIEKSDDKDITTTRSIFVTPKI